MRVHARHPVLSAAAFSLMAGAVSLQHEICQGILYNGIANKYNEFLKTKHGGTDGSRSPSREIVSFTSLLKEGVVFRHKTLPQPKAPILGNLNHNLFLKDYNKIGDSPGGIIPKARSRKNRYCLRGQSARQLRGELRSAQEELSHLSCTRHLHVAWSAPATWEPLELSSVGSEPLMGKRKVLGGENERRFPGALTCNTFTIFCIQSNLH